MRIINMMFLLITFLFLSTGVKAEFSDKGLWLECLTDIYMPEDPVLGYTSSTNKNPCALAQEDALDKISDICDDKGFVAFKIRRWGDCKISDSNGEIVQEAYFYCTNE